MAPSGKSAFAACKSVFGSRQLCPCLVPRAGGLSVAPIRRGDGAFKTFEYTAGLGQSTPEENRPPDFLHLVIESGDLRNAFDTFSYPSTGPAVRIRDGLLRSRPSATPSNVPRATLLGRRTWDGKKGTLVLAPSPDVVDSLHAGHLIFRWGTDGHESVISIHAWEPFTEVVPTLKNVVTSTGCENP
jgi:hypothetical protein